MVAWCSTNGTLCRVHGVMYVKILPHKLMLQESRDITKQKEKTNIRDIGRKLFLPLFKTILAYRIKMYIRYVLYEHVIYVYVKDIHSQTHNTSHLASFHFYY